MAWILVLLKCLRDALAKQLLGLGQTRKAKGWSTADVAPLGGLSGVYGAVLVLTLHSFLLTLGIGIV
jgi:hypothetical protein